VRRIVTGAAAYFGELGRAAARGWNAFFFTPADPTALGLIRLLVGATLFWNLLVYGLDLRDFFGSDGWADPATLAQVAPPYAWTFWTAVPDAALAPVWLACLAVLGLFTVGMFSRVTAVLAWVIVVATARRVPVALYGFDQAIGTWALYLAVTGASGQAVSLDRFLTRWRSARAEAVPGRRRRDGRWTLPPGAPAPSVSANLALRLIQLHLCLIYGTAGLAKLQGAAWWNGDAVWSVFAAAEFRLFDLTWLAAFPWLIQFLTHTTLALEIGYPVLVWVKVLRPLVVALAMAMHVVIALTLGLVEFGVAMVAANLAFASGPWLRGLVTGRDPGPAGRVLYDGACPRCRATMAIISAADPDRLIEPVDLTAVDISTVHPRLTRVECLKAMHVVGSDGRVWAGYDAVVRIGWWLPLFWPFALVGSLPGVTWAGRRAYNALAVRRQREPACTDATCGLHGPAERTPPTASKR
jgi:predicted DCC family thiol-disulfide oxidoreductase YuxK